MFNVGDIVRNPDGVNVTVNRLQKCLDCKAVVFDCVWFDRNGRTQSKAYRAKELTLIEAARPRPAARPRYNWAAEGWIGDIIIDGPAPAPLPLPDED